MKVFVTGIAGFIGSHLADYILENAPSAEVIGLKRWGDPTQNIQHILEKIRLYDGDLEDMPSLVRILSEEKPDCIFHLGAQTYVPFSLHAPIATLNANAIGTANLLEAVKICKLSPTIAVASSSEVYGQVYMGDIPIKEDCPFRPVSPYAASKLAVEAISHAYSQAYSLKIIRTRLFTTTGPRQHEMFVCSAFAKQIAQIEKGLQEPIIHVGNLDSVRTFCDVRDMSRAYWLVKDCPPGEVYNIGGKETMTIGEMLNLLLDIAGLRDKVEIRVDPKLLRPKDVTLQIPSTEKFTQLTGWKPAIPFRQTLTDLLNFWRERVSPWPG